MDSCNVILTKEEIRERNRAWAAGKITRYLRYGDRCGRIASQFFRIERPNGDPVLVCRCEAHSKNVSHGINDKVVSRLTRDEAIVCEIQDA